ncbi:hypothetical protein CLAFUW4_12695 [Fulvia fulva]|nr:hypothetical protein CLAFUR4_12700 [Fulvia fulva]WPV21159.1 hypothetical protein CLAFUW4_12695 [Fulvia fulva]
MSTPSTNPAVTKLDGYSTPEAVASQLQIHTDHSYKTVRVFIFALNADNNVALPLNSRQIASPNDFRLDKLPRILISKNDSGWHHATLCKLVKSRLTGPAMFGAKSIKMKDSRLIHVFDRIMDDELEACAVMACRIAIDSPRPEANQEVKFAVVPESNLQGSAADSLMYTDLNATMRWYRLWRDVRPTVGQKISRQFSWLFGREGRR